jgi:DNA-binding CsgD family transcriptional regulator/tetratricopeptide (TPR) repeat protein
LAAFVPGDVATAYPLAQASVSFFRKVGDNWGIAFALNALGPILRAMGDSATARSLLEESVMRFRQVGDMFGVADSLAELVYVAYEEGDDVAARATQEKMRTVLATQPLIDDKFYRTGALNAQGFSARQKGDDQEATTAFRQSLTLAQDIGMQWFVALAWQQLGFIAQQHGNNVQAREHFQESLELAWALGRTDNILTLLGCIAVAAQQEQWVGAARLYGAVEAQRTNQDLPFTPLQQADYERATSAVRARRYDPQLAAAWAAGQALSLEQAIEYALALPALPGSASPPVRQKAVAPPPPSYPAGLTLREVEVLRLLAQRFTYPQIAEKLVISRRTVNAHVTAIYSKLGVSGREAAIQFAGEHHLV